MLCEGSNFQMPFLGACKRRSELFPAPLRTVETRMKDPRFFLVNLDGFFSNGLEFSSPVCKLLIKVLLYQSFLNSRHCKEYLRANVLYSKFLAHFNTVPSTRILDTS